MLDIVSGKDRKIRGPAAQIEEGDPQLFFLCG